MSISSSLPPSAPSLAEVLVQRTFAKPVHALIDGDMLDALVHADDAQPAVAAPDAASDAPSVDVRA
ncbi:MAG TPA: hypothetical protein VGM33_17520 [Baekduia sp.]|jgi:hypothetical protein